ncbi:MAG: hypothetical protein IT200_13770 [Thermoleophilia bacterium]|nr:hypothetical protein [Thermoleophilia bacterium]
MTPPARSGTADTRLLAGAGLAALAAVVVVALAWSRSVWLGIPVLALLLLAPLLRDLATPRLTRARDLPETEEPELYRLVRQMCQVRERITVPRIMLSDTDAPVAVVTGWPRGGRLVVSSGLLTNLSHEAQMAVITRELSRLRQPYAAIDSIAWIIAPLAFVALVARIPSVGGMVLGILGLAIALAALVILVHARETIADDEALQRTGQRFAVEEAIRSIDDHPPSGSGWLLASGLLLVPPPRFVREFIPPTAENRVRRLADAEAMDTDHLMGTAADQKEQALGTLGPQEPDSTARMVVLGVLAVAAAIVVLVLTAGGGGGDGTAANGTGDGSTRASGATGGDGDDGGSTSTTDSVCPSQHNGNPDRPVILDASVRPDLFELRWSVTWCDDTDHGTTFVILRLTGPQRHMVRREIRSRSKPGTNAFKIVPGDVGWQPGRYRWRLVVRDINANTAERRSTGTVFVPGIP